MCISVGWWLGISSSLTPRRVSGSLLHFPRKSFRLLPIVLPHPLAGSHLPLLDPLLRGQAWVTSNTPTCSHILELLALNRRARKKIKYFSTINKLLMLSHTRLTSTLGLNHLPHLSTLPLSFNQLNWPWGEELKKLRLKDEAQWFNLIFQRQGRVCEKDEGGNRGEEEGWPGEIGKVKKSAASHPYLPWYLWLGIGQRNSLSGF